MEWKNKIYLLALIAILGTFIMSIPAVSATTTEIKAWDATPPGHIGIGDDWTISRRSQPSVQASLYVDGDIVIFRWLHLYVYDPAGTQIINTENYIAFFGFTSFHLEALYSQGKGDYKVQIVYWGSDDGDWPRADKWINLHII